VSQAADQLQLLVDKADISDVLYRYGSGLDARDWGLWRSAFCERATIDLSSFNGVEPVELPIDSHIRGAQGTFAGFDTTQHMITNHRHWIDGGDARVVAHMRAEHWATGVRGGDRFTMFGYYDNRVRRTSDGWRLCVVKLVCTRYAGNLDVMLGAYRRGKDQHD